MRRKIIPQGINALTVTLPRDWANGLGLKAGDEIEIQEKGKSLLISAEKESSLKKVSFDISDYPDNEIIWRLFSSFYRMGYDELEVRFRDINQQYNIVHSTLTSLEHNARMGTLEMVQDCIQRFIGLEIIEHGPGRLLIKSMSGVLPNEFEAALRRIFNLLVNAADESMKSVETGKSKLSTLELNDRNIDRLVDYCLRILNRKGHADPSKTSACYSVILMLEFLGDEFKIIGRLIKDGQNEKFSPGLIHLHESVNKLYNSYYEFFYRFSVRKASDIFGRIKELTALNETAGWSGQEKKMADRLARIIALIGDLVQLKLDMDI